jgi:hypothetical protein
MTLISWATFMCYNKLLNQKQKRKFKQFYKDFYSDYFLQLENIKLELQVIVNQNVTVNLFSGLVHTARHAMEIYFIWKLLK